MYVSVTGLKTNGIVGWFRFWVLAVPALQAAKRAPGLQFVSTKVRHGTHHTLTVWTSKEDMMAYRRGKAHRRAMKVFSQIATGRVLGFESDDRPSWEEALARYDRDAREVGARG